MYLLSVVANGNSQKCPKFFPPPKEHVDHEDGPKIRLARLNMKGSKGNKWRSLHLLGSLFFTGRLDAKDNKLHSPKLCKEKNPQLTNYNRKMIQSLNLRHDLHGPRGPCWGWIFLNAWASAIAKPTLPNGSRSLMNQSATGGNVVGVKRFRKALVDVSYFQRGYWRDLGTTTRDCLMSSLCKSDFVMALVDVSHIYIVIHVWSYLFH